MTAVYLQDGPEHLTKKCSQALPHDRALALRRLQACVRYFGRERRQVAPAGNSKERQVLNASTQNRDTRLRIS